MRLWGVLGLCVALSGCSESRAPRAVDAIDHDRGDATECVVRRDGTVWCWGSNLLGTAGQPASVQRVEQPTQVPGVTGARQVRLWTGGGCALTADGAWCWGAGHAPSRVDGLPAGAEQLVARREGGCALASAEVWCWGEVFNERITSPRVMVEMRPPLVAARVGSLPRGMVALWGGERGIMARDGRGELFLDRFSEEAWRSLARPRDVERVVVATYGWLVQEPDGAVWKVGSNFIPQEEGLALGRDGVVASSLQELSELAGMRGWTLVTERAVCGVLQGRARCVGSLPDEADEEPLPYYSWTKVKQVVGAELLYGLDESGAVRWSAAEPSRQLAQAHRQALSAQMSALGDGWGELVAIGADVVCARGAQRERRCWGRDGAALDAALSALSAPTAKLAASLEQVCALEQGRVRCVARGGGGVKEVLEGAEQLEGAYEMVCALKAQRAWCWTLGEEPAASDAERSITQLILVLAELVVRDSEGRLSKLDAPAREGGASNPSRVPLERMEFVVGMFEAGQVPALLAGASDELRRRWDQVVTFKDVAQLEGACALMRATGQVACDTRAGKVVVIEGGALQIVTADGHSGGCALMEAGGVVRCWEDGLASEIAGVRGLTQLDVGARRGCGVGAGGGVWCWGGDYKEELGVVGAQEGAVKVPGVEGASRVELWASASCAIWADGAHKCWGSLPKGL